MDRRSELPSVAAARARRDLHVEKRLESNRTTPTEPASTRSRPWVFTKGFGLGRVAQPNESRLSCGAKLEYSQMEFYHTAGRTFAGFIEEGRRQLQALVRLRTIDHSSGPSPAGARRGTHRHWPYAGIVMPNGPTLRTPQRRRGPRATGPSLGKRLESNRTTPTDASFERGADHVGVHKKIWFWESCAA